MEVSTNPFLTLVELRIIVWYHMSTNIRTFALILYSDMHEIRILRLPG